MSLIDFTIKFTAVIAAKILMFCRMCVDCALRMRAVSPIYALWVNYRHPISNDRWRRVCSRQALMRGMKGADIKRLRALATLFLHDKNISAAPGVKIDGDMRLVVALQACIPALGLGYDSLSGWREIIVYQDSLPAENAGDYLPDSKTGDGRRLSAPLLVSWAECEQGGSISRYGRNAVIHAVARKLEGLNDCSYGLLPLSPLLDLNQWSASLTSLYHKLERHDENRVFPRTNGNPTECFAILSEYFFCAPEIFQQYLPDAFRQFQFFYRQFPLPVKRRI